MRQAINQLFRYSGYLFLISFLNLSCNSSTQPNAPAGAPSLTWTHNSTTYSADDVDAYASTNTIIVTKDVSTPAIMKRMEIALMGVPGPGYVVGAYPLTPGGGSSINYTVGNGGPTTAWYSVSGTLNITSKSGNIINGDFNCVLNGANGTITGTFANLSIQ